MAAVSSLLAGALVWGLIWYPYRALQSAGVGGALSAFLTYLLALLPALLLFRNRLSQLRKSPWLHGALALAAGICNLGYVLAMIHGEVVRVMLLFYIAFEQIGWRDWIGGGAMLVAAALYSARLEASAHG